MSFVTQAVLVGSLLLFTGVLAGKLSRRFGVPALLLFLATGMLAGSEGLGGIEVSDPVPPMLVGTIALCLILFDGGLRTELHLMDRQVIRTAVLLSTAGVLITAAVTGGIAAVVLGVPLVLGLLLGAILSSTDAAAVFSVLRARGVGLPTRLRSLLEFESGSNDPTAVFLTVGLIELAQGTAPSPPLIPVLFVYRIAGGALLGWVFGHLLVRLINRLELEHDGLYPVLTLAAVGVAFGVAELLQTTGFMAVYIAGLTMSGRVFRHRSSLRRFHEGVAWLMQIVMFVILGLLVFPSQLPPRAVAAILVSAVLIVIARPLAVLLVTPRSGLSLAEKGLVSWVGLRGAAPIILATFPMVAGIEQSNTLFHTVFFAVILSVLVQGPTISLAARWLGLAQEPVHIDPDPIELVGPVEVGLSLTRLEVQETSQAEGKKLLEVGGPERPLVVLMRRHGRLFVPNGGSTLQAGDELFVLGGDDSVIDMREVLTASPTEVAATEKG